jgi:NADPH:quinone reductase-like Zn-dependent oxidoreductase
MKALVLNVLGRGFDFEDVDIAAPIGREVLVEVRASGLCHTDLLFATHDFVPPRTRRSGSQTTLSTVSTHPSSGPTSSARVAWLHKYGPGAW